MKLYHLQCCIRTFVPKKNLNEYQLILHKMSVDFPVFILTETWLDSVHEWDEMLEYIAYHSIRSDRGGGGVTVLIALKCSQREYPSSHSVMYCLRYVLATKLFVARKIYLIMGLYLSPSGTISDFNVGLA